VFADEEARIVARNIASEIRGETRRDAFDGTGLCYLETGADTAAYGSGNFYAYPAPRVHMDPPSGQFLRERRELERDRLDALV